MVRITGRKRVVGRPFLYGTTDDFLEHFGLNTLDDLPSLEEFSTMFEGVSPPAQEGATQGGGKPETKPSVETPPAPTGSGMGE